MDLAFLGEKVNHNCSMLYLLSYIKGRPLRNSFNNHALPLDSVHIIVNSVFSSFLSFHRWIFSVFHVYSKSEPF